MSILADGDNLASAEIRVGDANSTGSTFSNLILSASKSQDDEPEQPTVVFPEGAKKVYAFFDFDGMRDGMPWSRQWLADGEAALTKEDEWVAGRSGSYWIELTSRRGLEPGAYRLELLIGGVLAARSNFWVVEGQGEATFGPIVFAKGIGASDEPVDAALSFPADMDELYAFSEYEAMLDGAEFQINWYIDSERVVESIYPWDGGEQGSWNDRIYSTQGTLPDGEYKLELLLEGQVIQSGSAILGAEGTSPPQPGGSDRDGVQVQGTIADLDTGRPIPGALFLVLQPGISVSSFQWMEDELYTLAEADRLGYFELEDLLDRGQCYGMIVGADGYWTLAEDDVCILRGADSTLELEVQLERK
jgi:hypothetical protein